MKSTENEDNNIGKRINRLRLERGLTLEELGDKVGVGKSTVRKWENGIIANMRRDKIKKLADALDVSVGYLTGWDDTDHPDKPVRIPVYGRIAAGIPLEMITDIEDWEEIPFDMAKCGAYFALRIKGHSMEPRIMDGDVVIVRQQEDIENGNVAIVSLNGNEATCKKIQKYQDSIVLVSLNPAYEPMIYTQEEVESLPVRILGKVVELRGKF